MLLCSIATEGLKYGIPKFIPRTMKRQPKKNMTTGTSFLKEYFLINTVLLRKTISAISIGAVPSPKAYISVAVCRAVGVITAADSAIYTSPQGNRPFSTPAIARVAG